MKKLFVLLSIVLTSGMSYSQQPCNLKIGMNLAGPADWGAEWPFADIVKYGRTWTTFNHPEYSGEQPWDTQFLSEAPLDENGWPLYVPFEVNGADTLQLVRMVWANTFQLPEGDYTLLYEGEGDIEFFADGEIIDESEGRMTLRLTHRDRIMWMNINYSNPDNPFRNMKIILPGYENKYETEYWVDEWLEKLEPFKRLRFMDWGSTNNSKVSTWGERAKIDDYTYTRGKGIPYEYWIEICNRKQADAWVCVPHLADDEYIRNMAEMFRDNLDKDLIIYVEWSNEVWNWLFDQAHWANENLGQSLEWPERLGPKIASVMKIWTDVFGEESHRLRRVLATQHGWFDIGNRIYGQIESEGMADYIDIISPAAYMSYDAEEIGQLGENATPEDVIRTAREVSFDEENWVMQGWRQHAQLAAENGLQIAFYEGGQHFTPEPWGTVQPYNPALVKSQFREEMYDLYRDFFDTLAGLSDEDITYMNFSFINPVDTNDPNEGRWGNFGALTSQFFQAPPYEGAPKYRALTDFISKCAGTSADNYFHENEIEIFPNPAFDNLSIRLNRSFQSGEIRILSIAGRVESLQKFTGNFVEMDLSSLTRGIFFVEIRSNDYVYRRKFIKL